jgi:hypothetical protein
MTRLRPALILVAMTAAPLAAACHSSVKPRDERPAEFVGTWVRRQNDESWGDTLTFQADGSVLGSRSNPVPRSATWGVRKQRPLIRAFCAGDANNYFCRTYRFEGGLLILSGGPGGETVYRRVQFTTAQPLN